MHYDQFHTDLEIDTHLHQGSCYVLTVAGKKVVIAPKHAEFTYKMVVWLWVTSLFIVNWLSLLSLVHYMTQETLSVVSRHKRHIALLWEHQTLGTFHDSEQCLPDARIEKSSISTSATFNDIAISQSNYRNESHEFAHLRLQDVDAMQCYGFLRHIVVRLLLQCMCVVPSYCRLCGMPSRGATSCPWSTCLKHPSTRWHYPDHMTPSLPESTHLTSSVKVLLETFARCVLDWLMYRLYGTWFNPYLCSLWATVGQGVSVSAFPPAYLSFNLPVGSEELRGDSCETCFRCRTTTLCKWFAWLGSVWNAFRCINAVSLLYLVWKAFQPVYMWMHFGELHHHCIPIFSE